MGENIGEVFLASDGDLDLLMYHIGGPDGDSFQLSDPVGTGNSINLQTKAALDFETKRRVHGDDHGDGPVRRDGRHDNGDCHGH